MLLAILDRMRQETSQRVDVSNSMLRSKHVRPLVFVTRVFLRINDPNIILAKANETSVDSINSASSYKLIYNMFCCCNRQHLIELMDLHFPDRFRSRWKEQGQKQKLEQELAATEDR